MVKSCRGGVEHACMFVQMDDVVQNSLLSSAWLDHTEVVYIFLNVSYLKVIRFCCTELDADI
jgi:hypothetical protein